MPFAGSRDGHGTTDHPPACDDASRAAATLAGAAGRGAGRGSRPRRDGPRPRPQALARAQAKRAARIKAEAERLSFTGWDLTLPFLQRLRHLDELISRRTPYAVSASVNELAELRHLVANARAWLEEWQVLVDRDYQLGAA